MACVGSAAAAPRSARRPTGRLKAPHYIAILSLDRTSDMIFLAFVAPRHKKLVDITAIDEIVENFALLDHWEDRYRYVIELGRTLKPLPEAPNEATRCAAAPARSGCYARSRRAPRVPR